MKQEYQEHHKEFVIQNGKDWKSVIHTIFGKYVPETCIWTEPEAIVNVLNVVATGRKHTNHLFYPDSGGNDLNEVRLANEKGCINLYFDEVPYVVKPKWLIFEKIDPNNFHWSYFRLETDDMVKFDVREHSEMYNEYILEVDGNYVKYQDKEYLEAEGIAFTKLQRWIKGGAFVVFKKTSHYNDDPSTYDARHNKMSAEEFKKYIQNQYTSIGDKSIYGG